MPTPMPSSVALMSARDADPFAQAQMAAVAYLARDSGRTLETYRYDLRTFFQWCTDVALDVLEAKRPHIELWRSAMEERGLAPSTIDRRLSTICGFYRFAHIDGRITSNPAIRPPAQGLPERRPRPRPRRARPIPLHGRALLDRLAMGLGHRWNWIGIRCITRLGRRIPDIEFGSGHVQLDIIHRRAPGPNAIPVRWVRRRLRLSLRSSTYCRF